VRIINMYNKNPLATQSTADEIWLIDEWDLIWLLRCTRDVLVKDLEVIPDVDMVRHNIERIDKQLKSMGQ
jgi:hypothetical protein